VEKLFSQYDVSLREDKNMLDCLEAGLLYYIEAVLRDLTTASKIREEKGLELFGKTQRRKYMPYLKSYDVKNEGEKYFQVVVEDPLAEKAAADKKKLQAEKECLDSLKASPVKLLSYVEL